LDILLLPRAALIPAASALPSSPSTLTIKANSTPRRGGISGAERRSPTKRASRLENIVRFPPLFFFILFHRERQERRASISEEKGQMMSRQKKQQQEKKEEEEDHLQSDEGSQRKGCQKKSCLE